MVSKPFVIEHDLISFLIGGGNHPGATCLQVVIDGQVVASATGDNTETLKPRTLDVSEWKGENARLAIVDSHSGGWGHVLVDNIVFTNNPSYFIDLRVNSLPDFGTMTLSAIGNDSISAMAGEADVSTPDLMKLSDGSEARIAVGADRLLTGAVAGKMSLKPGEKKHITFLITWHFPNINRSFGHQRYYATRFDDASAVADHVTENLQELSQATRTWRSTWYDSTLPYWFLSRTFLNTSSLATSTSYLKVRIGRRYQGFGRKGSHWR